MRPAQAAAIARALMAVCFVALGTTGCVDGKTGQLPGRVVVPIRIVQDGSLPFSSVPTVPVSVGDGRTLQALLDTGSTGLLIPQSAAGQDVQTSDLIFTTPFGDGVDVRAQEASGYLWIGGVRSTAPVTFGIIRSITCRAKTRCGPANINAVKGGILGVGLAPAQISQPLLALPGRYAEAWSISLSHGRSQLILGARAPSDPVVRLPIRQVRVTAPPLTPPTAGALTLPTEYKTARNVNGDQVTACWSFAGPRRACLPTTLNSGSSLTQFDGSQAFSSTRLKSVSPGRPVLVGTPSGATLFWGFDTGNLRSPNLVLLAGTGIVTSAIAGVAAFKDFTVTYEPKSKMIELAPNVNNLSPALRAADLICQREETEEARTVRGDPKEPSALTRALVSFARISLRYDQQLGKLRLGPADQQMLNRALDSDRSGSRIYLQEARALTAAHTAPAYKAVRIRYASAYGKAEYGWSYWTGQLQLPGCA